MSYRVLGLSVCALVLVACAPGSDGASDANLSEALAFRGDSPRVTAIADAARELGVPRDVLLTLAWSETRLVYNTASDHDHAAPSCGLFGFDEGAARTRAARLVGVDADALCSDARIEARAAAMVLRELAEESGVSSASDSAAWIALLDAWHPALAERHFPYGEYVARMRREGFHGSDEHGESIFMPPLPELSISTSTNALGVSRASLTPDTTLADWRGPACDYTRASRDHGDVDFVIIHTCEGGFAGCVATLSNCGGSSVSAHYVTSYTGMSVQVVEENDVAWHVGCLNSASIGIEHEGFAASSTHPDLQYCQSARLVRSICDRWDIPCDRDHVIGHVEANSMFCHGSHTDPGPNWDWDTFMSYVRRGGCEPCEPTTEVCDGEDNDCDGMSDEGVANACGGCGVVPTETCDGHDNDCDGISDEGVLNACGACGPTPSEVCDGRDNDCDGVVDDGVCNGEDAGLVDMGEPLLDAGVDARVVDATTPALDGNVVERDGGRADATPIPPAMPMQPTCSAISGVGSRGNAGWMIFVVFAFVASARVIRRRA